MAAHTRIGSHVLLNRGALVGHHTTLGNCVSVNPGANIAGACRIENQAYVGMGALVLANVKVGHGAIIGAGAVVTRDVPGRALVLGIPACRIVNISSVAGKDGNPNMVAYSASKAGVIAITKSIGKEVATNNICVNAVTPAVIRTPILDQLTEEQVEYMTSRIPRGRTGTVEEVAAVVHFLASPDCSFVTAQTYDVSGGRSTF